MEPSKRKFIKTSGITALAVIAGEKTFASITSNKLIYSSQKNNKEGEQTMAKTHKCKITVLRRELYPELQQQYCSNPNAGKCDLFYDGQEFIIDQNGPDGFWHMMNGKFCSEAWDCISRYVYAALQGGSIMKGWMKDEKVMITCCNDGTRPVIFKLERIDEDEPES